MISLELPFETRPYLQTIWMRTEFCRKCHAGAWIFYVGWARRFCDVNKLSHSLSHLRCIFNSSLSHFCSVLNIIWYNLEEFQKAFSSCRVCSAEAWAFEIHRSLARCAPRGQQGFWAYSQIFRKRLAVKCGGGRVLPILPLTARWVIKSVTAVD
jgi:hypothetical protein